MIKCSRRRRGSLLLDALIGSFLLMVGAVAFYSLVGATSKSDALSKEQSTAVEIGNRMVEQLLLLRPSDLNATSLAGLHLIDSAQGSSPYSFTNFPLDDGWNASPAKALPSGSGVMTVSTLSNGSCLVSLTIAWNSRTGGSQSYTTGTIIGGYR